ncbi:N-acetylneuraminate synthase family protein [Pelagibacteraceae bacterium]|nr:N-acetylneuraminate synthase family protein [Pelagibacteraceae bacterium]
MVESKLIAEIGCNHKGDISIAFDMIKTLSNFCLVRYAKFQKRNNKLLLGKEYFKPHPVPENSYGNSYGEHRDFLEFSLEQHSLLKKECERYNIIYSCSVWDIISAEEIISLNPNFIKIPSAQNNNLELLNFLLKKFDGEVHISLGMTTKDETDNIFKLFDKFNKLNKLILYICTSEYPVDSKDLYLLEIKRIKKEYKGIKGVGFSGHHKGIAPDIAALTLGAEYIERHFTLDRTWKGTDHSASLEPDGIRRLQRDITEVSQALKVKEDTTKILDVEKEQREKLKFKS